MWVLGSDSKIHLKCRFWHHFEIIMCDLLAQVDGDVDERYLYLEAVVKGRVLVPALVAREAACVDDGGKVKHWLATA